MRVLLTGGSGAVGKNVLKQLVEEKNLEVVAFDMHSSKSKKFYKPYLNDVTVVYGDISKKEDLIPACKDIDVVIHLAAIIPPAADVFPDLAHKVNVIGTQNLLSLLEENSPNAFFLYASSVSVYGNRLRDPFIKIGDPLLPSVGDEYAKTEIVAEDSIQKSNLDWSIFRLSAIMGVDNHQISPLMFHMPLDTSMEITTPQDTGRAFVHATQKREQLSKRIFNLGGGEACRISYEEFLSTSFKIFGLGELNFPPNSFAENNFHCGYYADGDDLENIVHFRRDTITTYFEAVKKSVSPIKKFFAFLFKGIVKRHLLKQSDPLKAHKNQDKELILRYFNPEQEEMIEDV